MKNQGLTLFELMVCLLIAALTLLVAAPAFNRLMQSLQASRTTSELLQLCNHARSQAAGRRQTVSLCGSAEGRFCDGKWAQGVLMFHDADRSGSREHGEEIILFSPLELAPAKLSWKGFQHDVLIYESFGTPYAGNGTFTYCSEDLKPIYRRQVIVSRAGRARGSQDRNGDGVHESGSGGMITCP